jgi:flagellar hook-associated protein 3 FlgL
MATRITQRYLTDRTLGDLNRQINRLSTLQQQLATGLRINRPSDDPMDARRAINIQTQISQSEQFSTNISNLDPQLRETEGVFATAIDIFQRALELTVAGANETMGQSQLDQSAIEIDQLIEQLVLMSNTKVAGRSIFSGTRTGIEPFEATRDLNGDITSVGYLGNNEVVQIRITETARIDSTTPGDQIFQGATDLFNVLIGIRDDMRSGNQANLSAVRLAEIEASQEQISTEMAGIGALQNRLEQLSNTTEDRLVELQEQLSDRVDADFAETMLNFNVQQSSYQSALKASARVLQNSLMDFIR